MEKLTDGRKVLEPTSIDKISPAERFGPNPEHVRAVNVLYEQYIKDSVRVTPLMRRMGITQHPAVCKHPKKFFADYSMRWRCSDCKTDL